MGGTFFLIEEHFSFFERSYKVVPATLLGTLSNDDGDAKDDA